MYEAKKIFSYNGKLYHRGDEINPKEKDIAYMEAHGLIGPATITKVQEPTRQVKIANPKRTKK